MPTRGPVRFENPKQQTIYERLLRLIGPGPAAFYRDACRIMASTPALETTTHLVSHSLREIESALRDVLEPVMQRMEEEGKKRSSGAENHRNEIQAILKGLEIPETEPVAKAWLRVATKSDSYALHSWAHRDALAGPRSPDEEFQSLWDEMQSILYVVLEKFEARYLKSIDLLDEILTRDVPGQDDLSKLRNNVPNNLSAIGYFFARLNSRAWLRPLWDEGFFRTPPLPEYDDEQGTINFSLWPQSRYLARMATASVDPELVIGIILSVSDTDNPFVHDDLMDAALALPAPLSAQIVPLAQKWQELPHQRFLNEKSGRLIEHLARGGQVEAALDLARSLLVVMPDPREDEKWVELDTYRFKFGVDPQARMPLWDYRRILNTSMPNLVTAAGARALLLLCDLLEQALYFSRRTEKDDDPDDHSEIWRPEMEYGNDYSSELANSLVTAVVSACKQIVESDQSQMPVVIGYLEERPWHVFRRIALHLLRLFPDAAPELIVERLLDVTLLNAIWCQNEYLGMLRDRFSFLCMHERDGWLAMIEAGPRIQKGSESIDEEGDEEVAGKARRWRRKRLAAIADQLPADWRERHAEWVEGLEATDNFRVHLPAVYGAGFPTPRTARDLNDMAVEEIAGYLKTWQSQDFLAGTHEGLARELETAVASDPERFAACAEIFQELDPIYIGYLLAAFQTAVKQKRAFSWEPVLALCAWVVRQPRDRDVQETESSNLNESWGWVRKEIVELLCAAFEEEGLANPLDLKTQVWELIKPLTDDPDPTPSREENGGGSKMDAVQLAINSTRGEAMRAVIQYAAWAQRHIEEIAVQSPSSASVFDKRPEIREVLDAHLDPDSDPSLAVRSIYGYWLPSLVVFDEEWVSSRLSDIFPEGESLKPLYEAAWDSYVIYNRPYDNIFDVIRIEYVRAVDHIGSGTKDKRRLEDPEARLAGHLMTLYAREKLGLEEPDGLLSQFYAKAPVALRAHALFDIGHTLCETTESLPDETIARFKALWEWRIESARRAESAASYAKELAAFAWWFYSKKFEDAWAIAQLKEALELGGQMGIAMHVAERLAELSAEMPKQAVECLNLLIRADRAEETIHAWLDHTREILATCLASGDKEAKEIAGSLINYLSSSGHLEFRDLLDR
jgi:hypothetical protein